MNTAPRFMTDEQLRDHFGLSERALRRVKAVRDFPQKSALTNRTDSRAVDLFFDRMAGLTSSAQGGDWPADGEENFG